MKGVRAPALNHHTSTLPPGRSAYSNDGCRCDECRAGSWARMQEMREWFRAHPEDPRIPHGTYGGYTNYSCRCDECRRANTEYARKANRRRRERGA